MSDVNISALNSMRSDKIKDLGYLCYNMAVSGSDMLPEFGNLIHDIHKCIQYINALRESNRKDFQTAYYENMLDDKAMELGCLYFNMYVDKKVYSDKAAELCGSISNLNHMINIGGIDRDISDYSEALGKNPHRPKVTEERYTQEQDFYRSAEPASQERIKINVPYGMEPIPTDFKRCRCGYRNRSIAKYCGKCGAKL